MTKDDNDNFCFRRVVQQEQQSTFFFSPLTLSKHGFNLHKGLSRLAGLKAYTKALVASSLEVLPEVRTYLTH